MSTKQNKIIKQIFSFLVSESGETIKFSLEVDKNVDKIIGIDLSSNREDLLYYRGTQSIEINGEEFFPEGYESKKLMCGINVLPHQRMYALDQINPGNHKIDIAFSDFDNADIAPFSPYTVYVYVFGTLVNS